MYLMELTAIFAQKMGIYYVCYVIRFVCIMQALTGRGVKGPSLF